MKTFMFVDSTGNVAHIVCLINRTILTSDQDILAHAMEIAPVGMTAHLVDVADLPGADSGSYDKTFRSAYRHSGDGKVHIDVDHAKEIAHSRRRAKRDDEMQPFDEIIARQIPGKSAVDAEAERQKIRDRYALIQAAIDSASSADDLKSIIDQEGF